MRIPVSESEVGLLYPIGNGFYFISMSETFFEVFYEKSYEKTGGIYEHKNMRKMTFEEFKKQYPYQINSIKFRSKVKPRY